jgi:CHASE3 domain sensor protein
MHVKLRFGMMTGTAVAIFVVVSGTSWFSVSSLVEDQSWLGHSREVMSEFHNLLFRMATASTDQRTYLLTGQKDDLDDYRAQVKRTSESITKLRQLVQDNPGQVSTLNELATSIDEQLKHYDASLDVFQRDGREAAWQHVREEQKSLLRKVENLENSFQQEENRLLASRTNELMHSVNATQWTLIVGCLLSIAVVAAFNFYFGRHIVTCIRRLLNAAENSEYGRFVTTKITSNDEFGELGEAFNQLSLNLDGLTRKVKTLESDNVQLTEVRPLYGPMEQASKLNAELGDFAGDVREPVDAAMQKAASIFRNTSEVRRLLNNTDENLSSLKASIEECSEQADKLGGLQSELDNISNALEVISMSVDMAAPDGQPVLGAVMTRLHELSERCHGQRQIVGESLTRMQTLLSRAMLTAHASSGAETTGRQMLETVSQTADALTRELDQCRAQSTMVMEAISTQKVLLSSCSEVLKKISELHPEHKEQLVKKLQESLDQTAPNYAVKSKAT